MCAAILSLEGVTLGLTTPVMVTVAGVSLGTALWVGLGLAVACLVLAGMLRSEAAYAAGWVLQALAVGLGFVVPIMFFLGAVFAALWATAYFLGRKIERDRAAVYAAVEHARSTAQDGPEESLADGEAPSDDGAA